jgi:hypothetical protein
MVRAMSAFRRRPAQFIPIQMRRMAHILDFFIYKNSTFYRPPPKLRRKVYRFVPYMNRSRADVHVDVGACRNPTLDGELPHKAWRYAAY